MLSKKKRKAHKRLGMKKWTLLKKKQREAMPLANLAKLCKDQKLKLIDILDLFSYKSFVGKFFTGHRVAVKVSLGFFDFQMLI